MNNRVIPFSPPDISEAEIAEVAEALRSGWITTGPRTKEFERRISACCHTQKTVCLSSATAAEELALRTLGIGTGDEVIVPAYTYTATASAAIHVGATVRFVDSLPGSWVMDPRQVDAAVTEHTKAIIPVDFAGFPTDPAPLFEVAHRRRNLFRPENKTGNGLDLQAQLGRIAIVDDGAHSFGASRGGVPVGSLADMTCFSFHAVKNLTTAEGGALTWNLPGSTDHEAIYRELQLLSLHGQSKDALAKDQPGAWEYDIVAPYYKCNMTDIMAAIGLRQLDRYPEMIRHRGELIDTYNRFLIPAGCWVIPHDEPGTVSSRHLYILRVPGLSEEQRNLVIRRMGERKIACNVHYKPLPMMTAYRKLGWDIRNFPEALDFYRNEITLPLYSRLSVDDACYIAENFVDVLQSVRRG